jgi:Cd2+/Zn2+-exporting ATPase
LDGVLLNEKGSFNTSALTGESVPDTIYKDHNVLAGMINIGQVIEIKVSKKFSDSSISRILEMVQNATARKAQTELFIRKFARIYTPIVVLLATLLTVLPYFFVDSYVFSDWLYRALIFLVISCPCALVISIPLGYFGGIGAASRNGILFKGSNYLDLLTKVNTVVMDKTGTLTKGVFKVQKVQSEKYEEEEFLSMVAAIEKNSTHPIAKAIVAESMDQGERFSISSVEEISGHGLKGTLNSETILAGNSKLLKKFNVIYPESIDEIVDSIVLVALNNKFVGFITVSDEIKEDAGKAIQDLKSMSIETIMLSGDKQAVVSDVATKLGIEKAFGNLLPENKVEKVEELKKDTSKVIAFVGDGINDAPVLALSDVGIAMGGLGSDAAIETADVIIQTDHPSKIATAISIGKATKQIVWQNIILAFSVKAIVLALGAGGLATMWEAVFADVGVALLAILNSVRIQKMKFK